MTDPDRDRTIVPARTLFFAGEEQAILRPLAREVPVQVVFGDVPFGVMMLTPTDLEDFAYGFSRTEGVIETAADIRQVSVEDAAGENGLRLVIQLTGPRLHAHLARKRAMSGRTSCGLCGIEDLSALPRAGTGGHTPRAPFVGLEAIGRALAALDAHQPLNAATRAVHGAGFATSDGTLQHLREDVGRHNALDKLAGAMLRDNIQPHDGFVVITSRASFEMVEKAATLGVRTLVAVSAPTGLALERARALDLTLIGIARRDAVTVFHGRDRVTA